MQEQARRKAGRPPLDPRDRSVSVTVRLPSKRFDVLCRRAMRAGRSLAAQLRRELQRGTDDDDGETA